MSDILTFYMPTPIQQAANSLFWTNPRGLHPKARAWEAYRDQSLFASEYQAYSEFAKLTWNDIINPTWFSTLSNEQRMQLVAHKDPEVRLAAIFAWKQIRSA